MDLLTEVNIAATPIYKPIYNMDLLTEVNITAMPIYKHGPPDGGQHSRNADL